MLIDRYLIREIGASFAAVAIILTVVFLAYSLTQFLSDAAGGLLSAAEVAELTLYKCIIALEVLLPLGFYFGVVVGLGRLNQHSELTALRASGVHGARINRPLVACGALLAAVVAALSLSVRPWAYAEMYALKNRAEAASELDRIKPQRFYFYAGSGRTVYAQDIRDGGRELSGVFIRTATADAIEIIPAPLGRLDAFATPSRHRLQLVDASIHKSGGDNADFYGRFAALTLTVPAKQPVAAEYHRTAAASTALLGASRATEQAELQWRLSTPVSSLLLTLAALMLTDYRPRRSRFARLPLAVAVYAVYYNLLGVARTWVEQQVLPSLWWAPLLFGGALLAARLARRRRLA
ncbi:MAG: LPS export ABC transporter permease LptF [Gammaproteobacteria bacterium]